MNLLDETSSLQQKKLNEWLSHYGNDYIAHAVWQDNVEKVLTSGKLMSAEHVLRETHSVSFEAGASWGERGTLGITTKLLQAAEELDIPPPSKAIEAPMEIPETVLETIPPEYRSAALSRTSFELRTDPSAQKIYEMRKSDLKTRTGAGWLEVQIAIDMKSKSPIDVRLSEVWERNVKRDDTAKAKKHNYYLMSRLLEARSNEVRMTKLSTEIRALYNEIFWNYGDVIILRGNPQAIINHEPSKPLSPGKFVYTLEPFQNKGNFFVLELDDPQTIILGPQEILSKYRNNPKTNSMSIFYYEEMNLEQLSFFKVPDSLQPNRKNEIPPLQISAENDSSIVNNASIDTTSEQVQQPITLSEPEPSMQATDVKILSTDDVNIQDNEEYTCKSLDYIESQFSEYGDLKQCLASYIHKAAEKNLVTENHFTLIKNIYTMTRNLDNCHQHLSVFTNAYVNYNRKCTWSFFHRHGKQGRDNANAYRKAWLADKQIMNLFTRQVDEILTKDLGNTVALIHISRQYQQVIKQFSTKIDVDLKNLKGNNHNHSFKTYLRSYQQKMQALSEQALDLGLGSDYDCDFDELTFASEIPDDFYKGLKG